MKKHENQTIELDRFNLAPEVKMEVSNLIQALLDETKKQANELKLLEAKNQALVLILCE